MSETIFKYPLKAEDYQLVPMPDGARILTVQTQREIPCLWAVVDQDKPNVNRHIETFGTGHPMRGDSESSRKYIGTFQLKSGALVFHVFERLS